MIQGEKELLQQIEADRAASALWSAFIQNLHENEISWEDLQNEEPHPFSQTILDQAALPPFFYYTPSYKMKSLKKKKGEKEEQTYHLLQVEILLDPKQPEKPPLSFPYELFVERILKIGEEKEKKKNEE